MKDRIDRSEDEKYVYQPKLHSKRIKQLWILKEVTGIPMTVWLDESVAHLLQDEDKVDEIKNRKNSSDLNHPS